jgi:MoaA/NifB/PqqE/SkfB family radical SAM enzyme
MKFWQHVHWYFTGACNLDCVYCFAQKTGVGSPQLRRDLAQILSENGIQKVTITGGEPLLAKDIPEVLTLLKEQGIQTILHTNGTLLTPDILRQLKPVLDEIALPIDSLREEVQDYLRGRGFYSKILPAIELAEESGIPLVFHSVATARNVRQIPDLYKNLISKTHFKYWRVYEYNHAFAFERAVINSHDVEPEELLSRGELLENLLFASRPETGGTNTLLAHLLLLEERMRPLDKRIQFVAAQDYKSPYFFLDAEGQAFFCDYYYQRRLNCGNLKDAPFSEVKRRMNLANREKMNLDQQRSEEFVEMLWSRPLWARIYEGEYYPEEFRGTRARYSDLFNHLTELWIRREYGQRELKAYLSDAA